jgi:hypothetical protein
MLARLFAWLADKLGITECITDARLQSEWQYRQLEEKLIEIQAQLSAMQVDKQRAKPQEKHKAPTLHDYEASQRAVLDEFKEQQ